MRKFKDIAMQLTDAKFGHDPELVARMQPIFSYDNIKLHEGAEGVIDPSERAPLPPYSPDMHKVIEHVFNWLSEAFRVHVLAAIIADNHGGKIYRLQTWYKIIEGLTKAYETEWVQADIKTLKSIYAVIIENEGRHAPRPFN